MIQNVRQTSPIWLLSTTTNTSTGNNTYIKKSLYKDERGGEKDC